MVFGDTPTWHIIFWKLWLCSRWFWPPSANIGHRRPNLGLRKSAFRAPKRIFGDWRPIKYGRNSRFFGRSQKSIVQIYIFYQKNFWCQKFLHKFFSGNFTPLAASFKAKLVKIVLKMIRNDFQWIYLDSETCRVCQTQIDTHFESENFFHQILGCRNFCRTLKFALKWLKLRKKGLKLPSRSRTGFNRFPFITKLAAKERKIML